MSSAGFTANASRRFVAPHEKWATGRRDVGGQHARVGGSSGANALTGVKVETFGVVAWSERSGFICRLCRQDAKHNEVLGISFCPVHGLKSPLDVLQGRPEARILRGSTPVPVTAARPVSPVAAV